MLVKGAKVIIWTNAGILLIGSLWTYFSGIWIMIQRFSYKKINLKESSANWRPFHLSLNVLTPCSVRLMTSVLVECYDVLYTYLMGDSRKNELYIAKHISFFDSQISFEVSWNVWYMYTKLIYMYNCLYITSLHSVWARYFLILNSHWGNYKIAPVKLPWEMRCIVINQISLIYLTMRDMVW